MPIIDCMYVLKIVNQGLTGQDNESWLQHNIPGMLSIHKVCLIFRSCQGNAQRLLPMFTVTVLPQLDDCYLANRDQ